MRYADSSVERSGVRMFTARMKSPDRVVKASSYRSMCPRKLHRDQAGPEHGISRTAISSYYRPMDVSARDLRRAGCFG
jgi:hypothetical protein